MSPEMRHEQAFELLPWLVNDTLPDAEREVLERHVRACLVCRAELRSQRTLANLVQMQPTVDWSIERGFDALLTRMDHRERGARARFRWRPSGLGPRALLAGAAAAAAAVLAVAVWTDRYGDDQSSPGPYTVLTQPAAVGELVDIVFAPDVSESQMRALLQEIGVTIVAGPSELGRYTVRAVPGGPAPANSEAIVERLRSDPRVRFAGPSFIQEAAEATP